MSRITGWTAHIIEQAGSNALIRPLSQYSGLPQRILGVTRWDGKPAAC
jgi:citrate synthase